MKFPPFIFNKLVHARKSTKSRGFGSRQTRARILAPALIRGVTLGKVFTLSPNFLFVKAEIVISTSQDCCWGWIMWSKYLAQCTQQMLPSFYISFMTESVPVSNDGYTQVCPLRNGLFLKKDNHRHKTINFANCPLIWCPHGSVWGFFSPQIPHFLSNFSMALKADALPKFPLKHVWSFLCVTLPQAVTTLVPRPRMKSGHT